ncbi:phosphotransferase family protein [Pseudonocardia sp. TRM90224]|uniref:phosphotransferase family protein n=1 Tax=Pseudonocardia sp. TRM90224 TaxID=2812678 RepID=UPI001E330B4C|nr:phosphotransferase [Pseudonocardia sp. TRM90224]
MRSVTLVLCGSGGRLLGALPAFDVPVPWWQEVESVVAAARDVHGVDVTILRLLEVAEPAAGSGGPVTYLAEVADAPAVPLVPWPGPDPLADEPLRQSYARPGGPGADLAWADTRLAELGTPRTGPATQMRTWNLSSLWQLPTAGGTVWLKVVPPFFARESEILPLLDPATVPRVLATGQQRVLLADITGDDQYDATGAAVLDMVRMLVDLQIAWLDRTAELLARGAADWRLTGLGPRIEAVAARYGPALTRGERADVDLLVAGLDARFAAIDACGLPETLVHGDFHPGNVRGRPGALVLLDWPEIGVGHAMFDQQAFLGRLGPSDCVEAARYWAGRWRDVRPGADPDRAAELLAPVNELCAALIYSDFLDAIEPSERVFHADDPARALRAAVARPVSARPVSARPVSAAVPSRSP